MGEEVVCLGGAAALSGLREVVATSDDASFCGAGVLGAERGAFVTRAFGGLREN
jgi:hypothetical protein